MEIPNLCMCGCAAEAGYYKTTQRGYISGQPRKFIRGHNSRVSEFTGGQFKKGISSSRKGVPIESSHTNGCKCSVCSVKRGELKGKLHPSYGHKLSESHRKRLVEAASGKNSKFWKDGRGWYSSLHNWVRRELGSPDMCDHCRKEGLSGNKIHWANRSGKYTKSKNDWIRLCAKCHGEYDKQKGLRVGIQSIVKERNLL